MYPKPKSAENDPLPLEPSVTEHGVHGYTDTAVGGFGEAYAFQVAHGAEREEPGSPSESERASSEASASLARAVQKALGRAHIDAADVRVEADGNVVRLRGTVRHLREVAELEARARAVPGVSFVDNELFVLSDELRKNA